MKYFTPERYVAFQNFDDAAMDAADADWEEAVEQYWARFETIRPELPPGLRRIVESYYLHDARVHGLGLRDEKFAIALQLDPPPESLLTFTYDLVGEPIIDRESLPPEHRGTGQGMLWLYDEIERGPGDPPTWVQSILFENGWEVRLAFRDVEVQEAEALYPIPRNARVVDALAGASD